jgi:hypothetical protein
MSSSSDDENDEQTLNPADRESTAMVLGARTVTSSSEQNELLYALDMEYIKTHCLPRLPSHHRQILKHTLDMLHLKRSLLTHIQAGLHLPKDRMGYKQVATTQRGRGECPHNCGPQLPGDHKLSHR